MERRQLLGAVGTGVAVALAGCGSYRDGAGEDGVPGETLELLDLRYTVTNVATTETLDVLGEEAEGESPPTTRVSAGGNRFVVVDLTVENAGSESQGLPAPSPAPLAATGNVFISGRDNQAGNRGIPAASVAGPLVRDGEAARGYGYNVAALNWTLPPGDSVGGWIAFRVDGDYDLGENDIMVRIDNAAARWALRG